MASEDRAPAGPGDNALNRATAGQLRALVERIERLEEEKRTLGGDIKDVYTEAKAFGFDAKVLRKVVALRRQDANERAEQAAMLDLYLSALGMESFGEPSPPDSGRSAIALARPGMAR